MLDIRFLFGSLVLLRVKVRMRKICQEDIQRLYFDQSLSMQETADRLDKNITQIYKFMRRHNIPRRTAAETNRIYFYRSPLSFSKKILLSRQEEKLHSAAMMLYWAEGYKAGKTVDFVNSDPKMIQVFLRSLREIYFINETRLSLQLYCYSNQNPDSLIEYWSGLTNISQGQFIKPYVREDFKEEKSSKMPYGVIHLRYNDRRLYEQIMADIGKIAEELS